MNVSIIVCTKDRPKELAKCIESITRQSRIPDEVVIVHGGCKQILSPTVELVGPVYVKHIYSAAPSYLTADRNKGVRGSSGDIIIFVDDDVILHKGFVREIVRVFENDAGRRIGGAMGRIVNIPRPQETFSFGAVLYQLIRRTFLLPRIGDGRFLPSGSPTYIDYSTSPRDVEFLSGCCMAYRRELFQELQFDEDFLNAHLYVDDEDFSYRVSRKYRNTYAPNARLDHYLSPIGTKRHETRYTRARMTIVARHYLVKKNFPNITRHSIAFWWSVAGFIVEAVMKRDRDTLRGLLSGVGQLMAGGRNRERH